MQTMIRSFDDVSRRMIVTRAAQAFLGVGLAPAFPLLASQPRPSSRAKRVIYLYMTGGMSHLDTFDPKPGTPEQGPTESIETSVPGLRIADSFPAVARLMDKIALVRSMTTKQGAHDRGQYFMRTSYTPIATTRHPALGSWVTRLAGRENATLPGNVLIGGAAGHPGPGFLGSKYAPLPLGSAREGLQNSSPPRGVSEDAFERRLGLIEGFDAAFRERYPQQQVRAYADYYADAVRLMKSADLAAFDIKRESPQTRSEYGENAFGQGVLLARRLIEHGVRFVEVNSGGWDTHRDNFDTVQEKAAELDRALAALLVDLTRRGLFDETLVVLATEFGRTPQINTNQGRDHHPRVFTCLMSGGVVKGGFVHGESDRTGYAVETDGVTVPDFNATIAHALGIDIDQSVTSPDGRPFTLADKGQPVAGLLA